MSIFFLLMLFLAIVLLVVAWRTRHIWLDKKHWRIYCVLGAIVLGALMACVLNEDREREKKEHVELINSINALTYKMDKVIQELQKRKLEEEKTR